MSGVKGEMSGEDGPGSWSGNQCYGVGTNTGASRARNWIYRAKCRDVAAAKPRGSSQVAKGNHQGLSVGAHWLDQLSRAGAAARSHRVLVAELKPGHAWVRCPMVVTQLGGDAYGWCNAVYRAFVNCRNRCPCIVSDLHLVAASADFICSV